MTDRSYAIATLVGTSPESIDTAVRNAVKRAGEIHKHVDWFEVDQNSWICARKWGGSFPSHSPCGLPT